MYQRALEGYKKVLKPELTTFYIPVLNTAYNLGLLFTSQGDIGRAREMYLKALVGYQKVFGYNHQKCQIVQEKLSALNITISKRNTSADGTGGPILIVSQSILHSIAQANTPVSKRYRFFQKLGWR